MRIPRRYVEEYSRMLNAVSERGRAALVEALAGVDFDSDNVATIRDVVVSVMQTYCGASATMAARVAADFYDGLRALFEIDDGFAATVSPGRDPKATEGAVRAFVQDIVDGKPTEQFVRKCADRLDYEARLAANRCVEANARRDPQKPRWARVPTGAETCEFCIMLASRGFVYHNAELASHAHANCDCRVVPSWDKGKASVEGYDPDYYYDLWKHPERHKNDSGQGLLYDDVSAVFPIEKLTRYSMNPSISPDKAKTWEQSLGYTLRDANEVIELIQKQLAGKRLMRSGYNGYGSLYHADVTIDGRNGKTARVRTAWIMERDSDSIRLTSVYVKKRGVRRDG